MNESLLILSEDAVFSRMLELEFRMQRISVRALRRAEEGSTARVILVDLDTALPPSDCDGRVIGFTRSFSILASDPERRCSMILHRPFSMELLTVSFKTCKVGHTGILLTVIFQADAHTIAGDE